MNDQVVATVQQTWLLCCCSSSVIKHHPFVKDTRILHVHAWAQSKLKHCWIVSLHPELASRFGLWFRFQRSQFLFKHWHRCSLTLCVVEGGVHSFSGLVDTFSASPCNISYFPLVFVSVSYQPRLGRVIVVSGDRCYFQCCCMSSFLCINSLIGLLLLVKCLKLRVAACENENEKNCECRSAEQWVVGVLDTALVWKNSTRL